MEIIKAKDMIKQGEYHPKFMIMGAGGGGKTRALTTFPPSWKVLVLDFFGNPESLEGAANVDIVRFLEYSPSDAYAWIELIKVRDELVKMLETDKFPYNVLAIDTITGLIKFAENYILMSNPEKRGIGGAPAQHHYRGLSHVVGEYLMSFLGFPITVVLNAHSEPLQDKGGGLVSYQPIMSGARWRNTIFTYVGEVYRAFGELSDQIDEQGDPKTDFFWQTQQETHWPMLKSVMNTDSKIWGRYVKPRYGALLERRGIVGKGKGGGDAG